MEKNRTEQEKKQKEEDWYDQFYQEMYKSNGNNKKDAQKMTQMAKRKMMHLYYTPKEASDFLTM